MAKRFARISAGMIAAILILRVSGASAAEIVSPSDCSPSDASPCIQRAIERASDHKSDVFLMPGVYTLLHPVQLASNVSLHGASDTVIQPSLDNRDGAMLIHGAGVGNVRIEAMTFDGGGRDFPSESGLIVIDGTQNVVLDGVTIRHSRGSAFAIYSDNGMESRDNGIQNSLIFDIGNHWRTSGLPSGRTMGIDFWDDAPLLSFGNFAKHNIFRDIGLDAIHVAGQQGFLAEANFFELKNEEPEVLDVGDFPAAFFAETSSDLTVRDNTIHEAMGNCIDLPGVTGAVVEGNFIVGCGQSGIGIFQDYDFNRADSSDVVIRNNVILNGAVWAESPWKAGITIAHGTPANIVISGNIITDMRVKGKKTQDYGIEVVNDSGNNISTSVSKLTVDASNRLDGNQRSATHGIR